MLNERIILDTYIKVVKKGKKFNFFPPKVFSTHLHHRRINEARYTQDCVFKINKTEKVCVSLGK